MLWEEMPPPPPNPSTTATATAPSTSTTSDVSFSFESIKQFAEAFLGRFEQSQKLTQDLLIDLNLQNRGKRVANDYSNQTPNASLLAAPTENYQYGMPPNYFVGQTPPPGTVRPSMAEPVRLVQPTGQTGASVVGQVQPVTQTGAMVPGSRHSHSLRLFQLRLPLAKKINWQILCRCILQSHTVNPCFLHRCPKMFGIIGASQNLNMLHK